jgi:hypothetical protein
MMTKKTDRYKPNHAELEIENNKELENDLVKIYREQSLKIKSLNRESGLWTYEEGVDNKLDMFNYLKAKGVDCTQQDMDAVWLRIYYSSMDKAIGDEDYDEEGTLKY